MSWSESRTAITLDDVRAMRPVSQAAIASPDQFEAAKGAAVAVIQSCSLGDPGTHLFNVNLSGHANPGHEPAAGMANDCVYFNLSQATRALPEPARAEAGP